MITKCLSLLMSHTVPVSSILFFSSPRRTGEACRRRPTIPTLFVLLRARAAAKSVAKQQGSKISPSFFFLSVIIFFSSLYNFFFFPLWVFPLSLFCFVFRRNHKTPSGSLLGAVIRWGFVISGGAHGKRKTKPPHPYRPAAEEPARDYGPGEACRNIWTANTAKGRNQRRGRGLVARKSESMPRVPGRRTRSNTRRR